MIEQHPLDDFDLSDFFNCVKKHGMKGALALKQPELSAPKEDTIFASAHREFQAKIMRDFFGGKSFQSMNAIAREFTEQFKAVKQEVIAYSPDDLERKLYKETTIKTMAKVAEQNFDEAVTQSGRSLPNSPEQLQHRKEADAWILITQIVDIAVALEQ